jgi:hypothetical protein
MWYSSKRNIDGFRDNKIKKDIEVVMLNLDGKNWDERAGWIKYFNYKWDSDTVPSYVINVKGVKPMFYNGNGFENGFGYAIKKMIRQKSCEYKLFDFNHASYIRTCFDSFFDANQFCF